MGDKRIIITGARGQLGEELLDILKNNKAKWHISNFYDDVEILDFGSTELDITTEKTLGWFFVF